VQKETAIKCVCRYDIDCISTSMYLVMSCNSRLETCRPIAVILYTSTLATGADGGRVRVERLFKLSAGKLNLDVRTNAHHDGKYTCTRRQMIL
jgi:hypothetical protein